MRNEFFDKFIIEVKKQSRKGTNVRPAADFMLIAVPIWLILTRSKNLKHSIETWDARRNTRAAGFTHVVRYRRPGRRRRRRFSTGPRTARPGVGCSSSVCVRLASLSPDARCGPSGSGRAGPRIVGCSPDKSMLLISSSQEKQTAIKPRASRDREFLYE